ncbi:AAA family ATPase [Burkholderia sp. AU32262]|uniref:AAA family ATPase n=1 Tax=Burkholderia sp. AU32262 TaxID=2879630 RepID=UPI001CF2DF93|nr:ATP-binding protein [Burkholderia sp. AU32262]MCA8242894.1 ATP-binding protein [Burkholderia sp. AU32262]
MRQTCYDGPTIKRKWHFFVIFLPELGEMMIHWFEVSNFASFGDESTRIDFVPGKVVDDYTVFTSPSGARLSKFCSIFGPNAGGKTNLIRVLGQTANFIANSFRNAEDDSTPFVSNFFSDSENVSISIQFELAHFTAETAIQWNIEEPSIVYRYELVATSKHVVSEVLRRKTSHLFSRVFERQLIDEDYQYSGVPERLVKEIPGNISLISWLARQEIRFASQMRSYFSIMAGAYGSGYERMPGFMRAHRSIDIFKKSPDYLKKAIELLRAWDFGLDDMQIRRRTYMIEGKEEEYYTVDVTHRNGDREFQLDLFSESSGTIELFAHLGPIFEALSAGGVAIIDEIDEALHVNMIEAILDLFMREETNPKNAQLIFTSHSPWLMNLLNKWQVVLVEKRNGYSAAWRLSDMEGVHSRDNLSARYLAGAYGAVPRDFRFGNHNHDEVH